MIHEELRVEAISDPGPNALLDTLEETITPSRKCNFLQYAKKTRQTHPVQLSKARSIVHKNGNSNKSSVELYNQMSVCTRFK